VDSISQNSDTDQTEDLATELVRFFHLDIDRDKPEPVPHKTLDQFCESKPEWYESLNLQVVLKLCSRLEHAGYLWRGSSSGHPFLGTTYGAPHFIEENATYGEYRFVGYGYSSILDHFSPSIFPICVTKENEDVDIGTGFLAGNQRTVVTARHVVENMKTVSIKGPDGNPLRIEGIGVPDNPQMDIAIIQVAPVDEICPPLRFGESEVLDEVICFGYPPIPGFDNILIADVSTVNHQVRASRGGIVATARAYLDRQDYILINARVKGGNSGGPVINAKGHVVGILVQIPMDASGNGELDALGYGVAVSKSAFMGLCISDTNSNPPLSALPILRFPDGTACTLPPPA
jgi:serine protease Do